ncbi:2OG-Fe(II) oxygenase [uncultured Tenacibaculum sp.]|uniref:prolyl hydroxylase family protein n=1 Tax=uncultured Tenacibaculum sp. TaxID=174713 RepID=UPI0026282F5C|nr:2OG-Fe(II) oxygenase [uncultured Tenacibaculum sp.]
MKKIELHPEVFTIENFFTSDECNEYLELYKNIKFEEAKISIDGQQVMNKNIRNNDRHIFFNKKLAEKLWNNLKQFIPEKVGFYKALELNEMFRVYKYSAGQRFKMHIDGSFRRNLNEESLYSFLIYLNDDFEGGETEFRKMFTITPQQGTALVFKHRLKHEGKEIMSGTKYVLRTDIMYKRI